MRYFLVFISSLLIIGCSFGGFKPPPPRDSWSLHNGQSLFPSSDPDSLLKYVDRREKDMRACGIDPVIGDSTSAKVSLCMESKGWYEKKGPVCEKDPMFYDDPLCVKWRAKRKR